MDGIEKITAKINADAQAEIDALMAKAEQEAAAVTADFQAKARALKQELEAKGGKAAAEREERMASVAQLEARKAELAAKQDLLDRTFDRALEKLCALKDSEYIDLLAGLIAEASSTGQEEILFSQADRDRVGERAVAKANELLAKKAGIQAPEVKTGSGKLDAVVEKVGKAVAAATAAAKGAAALTLSAETRPIRGGFILREGKVEVNCAFETLVRLQRTEMAGEVAKALFGES